MYPLKKYLALYVVSTLAAPLCHSSIEKRDGEIVTLVRFSLHMKNAQREPCVNVFNINYISIGIAYRIPYIEHIILYERYMLFNII